MTKTGADSKRIHKRFLGMAFLLKAGKGQRREQQSDKPTGCNVMRKICAARRRYRNRLATECGCRSLDFGTTGCFARLLMLSESMWREIYWDLKQQTVQKKRSTKKEDGKISSCELIFCSCYLVPIFLVSYLRAMMVQSRLMLHDDDIYYRSHSAGVSEPNSLSMDRLIISGHLHTAQDAIDLTHDVIALLAGETWIP